MRAFADYHPAAVTVYFLAVSGIAMFCMHPVIIAISLLGALLLFFVRNGRRHGKSHLYFLGLFLVMTLINPLVSHNGATVLFVMNHNPVTLEALLYGAAASGSILSVLYWLRSFSQIMTSDKLLYLFSMLSPKLSLVLSMAIRYVSLFSRQTKKAAQAQKALGLYKEDNVLDSLRGGIRVFSVMLTWALENGIITADSMAARGYGTGKRTHFSLFRFRGADACLLLSSLLCFAVVCAGIGAGVLEFRYYPVAKGAAVSYPTVLSCTAYALLALLPTVIQIKEAIKWNCFVSNI